MPYACLIDYNELHQPSGSSVGGQFAPKPLGKRYSKQSKLVNGVVQTSSVYDATRALYEHRKVELKQAVTTSTFLDHLADVSKRMIERGSKVPNFNLCDVSVPGTNLFCAETHGIPRIKMPQMSDEQMAAFRDDLQKKGFKVTDTEELAGNLKATQNELNGSKVAAIARKIKTEGDKSVGRTMCSRDNYILDGHHRWAARVGLDAGTGKLKTDKMPVQRVDIGIIDLLNRAKKFTGGKGAKGIGDAMWRRFLADIYKSVKDLPGATKKLSHHKKRIWRAAFNSAFKQYKGDESKAWAVAYAAANKVSDAVMAARHHQAAQDQDADDITLTQAALLKLMEYGREDAKEDLDIHKVVEQVAAKHLKKGCVESGDLEGVADAYDPDEDRDERGRWTSGPGKEAGKGKAPRKPEEVSRAQTRPSTMTPALHRKIEKEAMAEAAAVHAKSQMSERERAKAERMARRAKDAWTDPLVAMPAEQYDQLKPKGAQGSNSYGQEPGTIPLPTSGYGVREITASMQFNELKGPEGRPLIFATEQEATDRAAQLAARTGLNYLAFRAD